MLADGGIVQADVASADKESLVAESDLLGTAQTAVWSRSPARVFHRPADRHDRDLLIDRIARATGETDRVLLDNGDEVSGLIETIAGNKIHVKAELGPLDIETPAERGPDLQPGAATKSRRAGARRLGRPKRRRPDPGRAARHARGFRGTHNPAGPNLEDRAERIGVLAAAGRASHLPLRSQAHRGSPPAVPGSPVALSWGPQRDRRDVAVWPAALPQKGSGFTARRGWPMRWTRPANVSKRSWASTMRPVAAWSVGFRVFVDGKQKYASDPIRGGAAPAPGVDRLDPMRDNSISWWTTASAAIYWIALTGSMRDWCGSSCCGRHPRTPTGRRAKHGRCAAADGTRSVPAAFLATHTYWPTPMRRTSRADRHAP